MVFNANITREISLGLFLSVDPQIGILDAPLTRGRAVLDGLGAGARKRAYDHEQQPEDYPDHDETISSRASDPTPKDPFSHERET